MRVDRIIKDAARTLRQLAQALDNNITVNDNFGPSGAPQGWTIISQGPKKIPKWGSADGLTTGDGEQVVGGAGAQGPPGPRGVPGADGTNCTCDGCPEGSHLEPLTDGLGDLIYVYDADGDLDLVMVCVEG